MKTLNFFSKFILLISVFWLTIVSIGICGSGGGSGRPRTPYQDDEIITVEKILKIKALSNRTRSAKVIVKTNDDEYDSFRIRTAGFYFLQDKKQQLYTEPLGDMPEDFVFDNFGIENISFDNDIKMVVLKGVLNKEDQNRYHYNVEKLPYDKEHKIKLHIIIDKLFFSSNVIEEMLLYIEGFSEDGVRHKINLNEIESIKVLKVDTKKKKMLIEVDNFPDILPDELLSNKYTYTELREKFTKILRLWIDCINEKGKELYIAEIKYEKPYFYYSRNEDEIDDWFKENKFFVNRHIKFIDLGKKSEISLSYINKDIWWAVPSVVEDIHYPYPILMFKK